jgi:hypothetical protein
MKYRGEETKEVSSSLVPEQGIAHFFSLTKKSPVEWKMVAS